MPDIFDVVGQRGAAHSMIALSKVAETSFHHPDLEDHFAAYGVADPDKCIDGLMAANLLQAYGPKLGASLFGLRSALLLEALAGADIDDVYRRIRKLGGQEELYELVRQGMTLVFLQGLVERPDFGRLYICSPWINLSRKETAHLRYSVMEAEKRTGQRPEVLVITRPRDKAPKGTEEGLAPFEAIGAEICFHPRLHSKLYIREPAQGGGYSMAIVGSQNMTKAKYFELGIRINSDSTLINQLIRYFFEVMSLATE